MVHYFSIDLAKFVGVDEAIFINNIYFWVKKNECNNKHFYDGYYWTYNSMKAFADTFPYWSQKQIERIIRNCTEKGLLLKGNYNASAYDRTTWYAYTDLVKSFYENREIHFPKQGNGFPQTGEPIPYNKPYNNTNNKPYEYKSQKIDLKSKYENYKNDLLAKKQQCESLMMKFKMPNDLNYLSLVVDEFNVNLRSLNKVHENNSKYEEHFLRWGCKLGSEKLKEYYLPKSMINKPKINMRPVL